MEEQFLNPLENNSMLPDDVQEKLAKVIERYQQMSDEEKEQFQKGAFDVLTKTLHELPRNTILPTWLAPFQSYILFFFAVSIVTILLGMVFFTLQLHKIFDLIHDENTRSTTDFITSNNALIIAKPNSCVIILVNYISSYTLHYHGTFP